MRPQLAKGVGGDVSAIFGAAVDQDSCQVTIKRNTGADLEDAAVSSVALNPVFALSLVADMAAESRVCVVDATDALPAVGERVTLSTAAGKHVSTIRRVDSTTLEETNVYLRTPAPFAFPAGATFRANRAAVTVSAANCPRTESNFRALFVATIGGNRAIQERLYDVGLRDSYNPATPSDVLEAWPDLPDDTVAEWISLDAAPALLRAYDHVEILLAAEGRNINRVRDVQPLVTPIVTRALWEMAQFGLTPSTWVDDVPGWIDRLERRFASELATALAGLSWYEDDDSGTLDETSEGKGLTFGQVNLTR